MLVPDELPGAWSAARRSAFVGLSEARGPAAPSARPALGPSHIVLVQGHVHCLTLTNCLAPRQPLTSRLAVSLSPLPTIPDLLSTTYVSAAYNPSTATSVAPFYFDA